MKDKYTTYYEGGILRCEKVLSEVYVKSFSVPITYKDTTSSGRGAWWGNGYKRTELGIKEEGYVLLASGTELPVRSIIGVSESTIEVPPVCYAVDIFLARYYGGRSAIFTIISNRKEDVLPYLDKECNDGQEVLLSCHEVRLTQGDYETLTFLDTRRGRVMRPRQRMLLQEGLLK